MRGDRGGNNHLLCKIDEGHPKTNNNTQHFLTTIPLGNFPKIACRQSECILFDTELTCFESMAIFKRKGGGEGRPTDKHNRQFCECTVRQQGRSVFI